MTRNSHDRMIDSRVWIDDDGNISGLVYAGGKYYEITDDGLGSPTATEIWWYLMGENDGSSDAMSGALG